MPRRSDFQDAIVKLRKLKALQAKATEKLDRIGRDARRQAKKAGPARKKKAKTPAKKPSFWQRLFHKKNRR